MRASSEKTTARGNSLKRCLDHVVGTPLLLLLALLRQRQSPPERVGSAGILSCSAIGDTIIASAIGRDLKSRYPYCTVVAFIAPSTRGVVDLVEGFDKEVIVPITHPLAALRILRENPTDVLIDITAWPRITAIIAALANARFTIGFKTAYQHRHFAYDAVLPHSGERHELLNFRALLQPLGIFGRHLPSARSGLRALGTASQLVVFHPWASGFRSTMREWPLTRWAQVAQALIERGATISITGGPSDRERAEALAMLIDRPGRVTVMAGSASLYNTAERVASAELVISVNTGIMHLAAALERPLVALHGPTNPRRWGPLTRDVTVLGADRSQGGAYLNLGFEYPRDVADCMDLIDAGDVARCATRRLETLPAPDEWHQVAASARGELILSRYLQSDVSEASPGEVQTLPRADRRSAALVKRSQDLAGALALLIVISPVLAAIAIAIKLDSRGPILFHQYRIGQAGRIIKVYKFRSMYHDLRDPLCLRQTTRNDPRVTRVGALLRRFSLDELPQLINVIGGNMSLVGPRPHAVLTSVDGRPLEDIVESYRLRLDVKPGITGLAQVNGWRGPLDSAEKVVRRVEYDLMYVANRSFWLDTKILLKTAVRFWNDREAY